MTAQAAQKAATQAALDEMILVVERQYLFQGPAWQGLNQEDLEEYLDIIWEHKQFIPRSKAENDPRYKQIIPYLVFAYEDQVFLMQREKKISAPMLANKFSIGIGGHMRQEDVQNKDIFAWAEREFHEEVDYKGQFADMTPIGILNDDSDAVGEVHLGVVLLLEGTSNDISIKSEHKSGTLVPVLETKKYLENMESWSRIILEALLPTDEEKSGGGDCDSCECDEDEECDNFEGEEIRA